MSLESGQDDGGTHAATPEETGAGPTRAGEARPGNPRPGDARPADHGRVDRDAPDLQRLAQDWITLWESEISALAADPELREAWQAMAAIWAGAMSAALRAMPRGSAGWGHDRPARSAGATDAPRATPAAAAPDARDAEIERLARHIDTLEQRLADLERGDGKRARRAAPRRGGRKPRKAE